jgi:hypothetical protein
MATFGQGINAQLGAIDYSAYQRGAAQGAQSIGQGLANLGQEVGAGLKKRGEYKNSVTSAKKLIAGLNTLNIPEEVKTQMGVLGAQIDDPNISLSEQSAIATRLTSLADGIVGAGLKQSFEDAKNKRISDAVKSIYTTQTPEESIKSFNNTLAGKPQKAFVPKINESKLGNLLSVMPADQAASYINALSNREKVLAGDPKLPYEIARLKAGEAKDRALELKAGEKPTGFKTEKEALDSVGGNPTTTGTYFSGGYYYPRSLEANQEGSVTSVTVDGTKYPALVFNNQLVDPDTKLPIFESSDMFGAKNTRAISGAWRKSKGLKVEDPGEPDPDLPSGTDGKINKTPIKLRLGIGGLQKR